MSWLEVRGGIMLILIFFLFSGIRIMYNRVEDVHLINTIEIPNRYDPGNAPSGLVAFDPDTISENFLNQLGLPSNVSRNWVAYRKKAGGFTRMEQIKNIYGMSDSLFGSLHDSIILSANDKIREQQDRRWCPDPMDLNMADSVLLMRLHGIGKVLSRRIIAYRKRLGGFVSADQLKEVYGLKDSTYSHIRSRIYVDEAFRPEPIDLAHVNYQQLYDHPYISSRQAVAILRYREHHPDSVKLEDILALEKTFIQKIQLYIKR